MTEGASISTADIRRYANLPSEAPEALLQEHLGNAKRNARRTFGREDAPLGLEDDWRELIIVSTLISAIPWLHMVTMEGVSKAGRLEGEVDFRFMEPEEIDELLKRLNARGEILHADISNELAALGETSSSGTDHGPIGLIAV